MTLTLSVLERMRKDWRKQKIERNWIIISCLSSCLLSGLNVEEFHCLCILPTAGKLTSQSTYSNTSWLLWPCLRSDYAGSTIKTGATNTYWPPKLCASVHQFGVSQPERYKLQHTGKVIKMMGGLRKYSKFQDVRCGVPLKEVLFWAFLHTYSTKSKTLCFLWGESLPPPPVANMASVLFAVL